MAKFNKAATKTAKTFEGGKAFKRDPKSDLFLLAVTNMAGEDTFYESADARDERYRDLVHSVAVSDPEWMLRFVTWLRAEANMRSAAVVAACESVRARLDAGASGYGRQLIAAACQRADEPGEVLAYWTGRYGRALPKPVKRGVADAVARLYNEYSFAKYDSDVQGLPLRRRHRSRAPRRRSRQALAGRAVPARAGPPPQPGQPGAGGAAEADQRGRRCSALPAAERRGVAARRGRRAAPGRGRA